MSDIVIAAKGLTKTYGPPWKRWLARRFADPYYFRFDAEIEMNVDLAETKGTERGSTIYELMMLR